MTNSTATMTLGTDSTLKQFGNGKTEIQATKSDTSFFVELIQDELEMRELDQETINFLESTQDVFASAIDGIEDQDELVTITLTEEQKDYFFYDLLQGIMYEGTRNIYLDEDHQECWDAMEKVWMQLHPDHQTREEQIKEQEEEDAKNEALAKEKGFNSYKEWVSHEFAVRKGFANYEEFKKSQGIK